MPYSRGPQEQVEPDASMESPGGGEDMPMDSDKEESSESLFIPPDCLGGKEYAPGDTITFKVVGKNSDGELEVSMDEGSENESGGSDEADAMELRKALGSSMPMRR